MKSADAQPGSRQPGPVDLLISYADRLAMGGAYVAMACLLILALLMLGQVVVAGLSKVFSEVRGDIPVGWEYGSYLMGAAFMLGSGITLRAGRHIRLSIVVSNAPPLVAKVLELFSTGVATVFVAFLVYSLAGAGLQSFRIGTTSIGSGTPVWIPMTVFAVGAAILLIQLVVRLVAVITGRQPEDLTFRASESEVS